MTSWYIVILFTYPERIVSLYLFTFGGADDIMSNFPPGTERTECSLMITGGNNDIYTKHEQNEVAVSRYTGIYQWCTVVLFISIFAVKNSMY